MAHKVKIELLNGRLMNSDKMIMGQVIDVQGIQLLMDLIVFEILNFNMILGMDFLWRNRAKINCRHKKVQFNIENEDQFEFDEGCIKSLMIIVFKVKKMLSKRFISFLAYRVSKVESSPSIEETSIVREFIDMFLIKLSGLTPE